MFAWGLFWEECGCEVKHGRCALDPWRKSSGCFTSRSRGLWAGWDSEVKGQETREQGPSQTELTCEMTPSKVTPVNTNTPTENASPLGPSFPSRNNTIVCLSVWLNASFFLGGGFILHACYFAKGNTTHTTYFCNISFTLVVTQLMRKIGIVWNHILSQHRLVLAAAYEIISTDSFNKITGQNKAWPHLEVETILVQSRTLNTDGATNHKIP